MVILLPGCDGESLRVLADFLYTGTAVFVREDVGNDFYALLAKEIQVILLKLLQSASVKTITYILEIS